MVRFEHPWVVKSTAAAIMAFSNMYFEYYTLVYKVRHCGISIPVGGELQGIFAEGIMACSSRCYSVTWIITT
jgi:hypothetical protein